MMEATKTETLVDVLRDLRDVVPERIIPSDRCYVYASDHAERFIPITGYPEFENGALIVAACMEECDCRGWKWSMRSCTNGYVADITEGVATIGGSRVVNSPALALATALRDALKAQS